jgi:hypothetical protein
VLSSHIVEVVSMAKCANIEEELPGLIEQAYMRLSQRAKVEDSLIVGVVQAVGQHVVVITAQRIGREELEKQQRLQRMQGGRAL